MGNDSYLYKNIFMNSKTPSASLKTLTDLVLPGETNYLDNLFGNVITRQHIHRLGN